MGTENRRVAPDAIESVPFRDFSDSLDVEIMQQGPVCKSVFPPDNDFCLIDGTPLATAPGGALPDACQ